MVKLNITISNNQYSILDKMRQESGIQVKDLVKLFVIERIENYRKSENINNPGAQRVD